MILSLNRTQEDEKKWQEKLAKLQTMWKIMYGAKKFEPFSDIDFLKNKANIKPVIVNSHGKVGYYFEVDYPYENSNKHFCIVPSSNINCSHEFNAFKIAQQVVNLHLGQYQTYILVKKGNGSIEYPHFHLLFYK